MNIAVIGAGRLGSALTLLLYKAGYNITGITSKTYETACTLAAAVHTTAKEYAWEAAAAADIVFITTPDKEIASVTAKVTEKFGFKQGQFVFHTSGALTSEALSPAKAAGSFIAALHPLQTFADISTATVNLPGSLFTLEGDAQACLVAQEIVADLHGKVVMLDPAAKPLYHAAACIASNYLVALTSLADKLLQDVGLTGSDALTAILALMRGTINNMENLGCTQALTGPICRNDLPTITNHLNALQHNPQELQIYCLLGQYTAQIAAQKNSISPVEAQKLVELLNINKRSINL